MVALDVLSRHGDGHPRKGAGRSSRSARDSGAPFDGHPPMASVLEGSLPTDGERPFRRRGPSLVCRHVVNPWSAVRRIRAGQYGRPLSESDGRAWLYDPFLRSGPVAGILSLERVVAICMV